MRFPKKVLGNLNQSCIVWSMETNKLTDSYETLIERRIEGNRTQLYSINIDDCVITVEYALVNELNGEWSLEDSLACPDMRSALDCLQNWASE